MNKIKYNITVLMSTYNGEKFLQEQIDSILAQKDVNIKLIVRDDGSTDSTMRILSEYEQQGKLSYYTGKNLGPQLSFMHLLQHADANDYYAFADQDDFWLEDKLYSAISHIEGHSNEAALYFCQTQLTDEELNLKDSIIISPKLTFGESLIYKFIGGCTMVMNKKLKDAIGTKIPHIMPMHDIWIYSIALSMDAYVYFDRTSHILYRQHGNNTVGQGQSFLYVWKERYERFIHPNNKRYNQALELGELYSDIMTEKNEKILNLFLSGKKSFWKRMNILFSKDLRCSDCLTQLLFWINVIINKY